MISYVEKHGGAFRIRGSRVSLDSVVHAFRNGETPEGIVQMFPTLSLEQVYGAITYYLAHQSNVDEYLKQGLKDQERQRQESRAQDPELFQQLAAVKAKRALTR